MKKKYIIPVTEIVKVQMPAMVCTSEQVPVSDTPGSANDAESRSITPKYSVWEDEEEEQEKDF